MILQALGGHCSNPNCPIPPEKMDKRALHIDHINGGAYREGRRVNNKKQPYDVYLKEVYKNVISDTPKYQLLCAYCNWIKRFENHELPESKFVGMNKNK